MKLLILFQLVLFSASTFAAGPYFWHITDFHYDPTYWTTQESCNEVVPSEEQGMFGSQRCDSPWVLVRSSVDEMQKKGPNPEFILYTGDTPPHPKGYPASLNEQLIHELHVNASDLLREFFPDSLIVFAIGNHDFFPKDQIPGHPHPQYDQLADLWFDDPLVKTEFKKAGYYSMKVSENYDMRVVVTNTNLYLPDNDETLGEVDPGGQYAWLREVLSNATRDGEYVYLITHVPFGVFAGAGSPRWVREADNIEFNSIVREYANVIKGHFSCHEHTDAFHVIYNITDGTPVNVMFITPSVTPWAARIGPGPKDRAQPRNPGFRKFIFTESTGDLEDYVQYFFDLIDANDKKTSLAVKKFYTFNHFYGTSDLSPQSIHDLVEQRFKDPDDPIFEKWWDMNRLEATDVTGVFTPEEVEARENCDCECRAQAICSLQEVEYADFDVCKANALNACNKR